METARSGPKSQIPVGCHLCQGINIIQWRCWNCDKLMCTSCKDNVHHGSIKDHSIVNIKEIREVDLEDDFNFSGVNCSEHTNQICCSYCKTCKKVVCGKCIMKIHNGHEFVNEEEFKSQKENIRGELKKAEKKVQELRVTERKLAEMKTNEEAMYSREKDDIMCLNNPTKDFQQRGPHLKELDEQMQIVNQEIDTEQKKVKRQKKNFKMGIDFIDKINKTKDFCDLIENYDKIKDLLKSDIMPVRLNLETISDFVIGKCVVHNFSQLNPEDCEAKISFKVIKQYTTDIRSIHFLAVLSGHTIWIADNKIGTLQHVKKVGEVLEKISHFNIRIYSISVNSSRNHLLVSTNEEKLKLINTRNGEITDSIFDVGPLTTCSAFEKRDQKVLISAKSPGEPFPASERCVVIEVGPDGKHLMEFEHDSNNMPLFTIPVGLASAGNGYIFVVDILDADNRGRVVVLDERGGVIQIYAGHPNINTEDRPFKPSDILALSTTSENILILDCNSIHTLDNEGKFISHFNLNDIGIEHPYSFAQSSTGDIYIGCSCSHGSSDTYKAKLYVLKFSWV